MTIEPTSSNLAASVTRDGLYSEDVILDAPMSFTGCTKRTLRFMSAHRPANPWWNALAVIAGVVFLLFAYAAIAAWYLMFGLLLVPYRLIRRSQRRDEQRRRQHAELLAQMRRDA